MSIEKVIACIKKNKNFLITAHTHLEGDALGSELAFCRLLKKLGKSATIINEDKVPIRYDFLPGINRVRKIKKDDRDLRFDCFSALDCSDLKRCGSVSCLNSANKPVLNIDHHISNLRFGAVNWVEPKASSCCEMIYKLYKRMKIPLDRNTALVLYAGILTDTGSFRYPNTTSSTHRAVAELTEHKLDIAQIYKHSYENMSLGEFRLLVKILPGLHNIDQGKVAWFQIKNELIRHKKISFDLADTLLSFARAIKGVEICAVFKENLGVKDEIRVNLRSQGRVDVNKIAKFFGGGGHKTASGCTIRGSIDNVRKIVLKKIRSHLK